MDNKSALNSDNVNSYKNIYDLVPNVFYQLNSEGNLFSISPSFEHITGWKRKIWIGKKFTDLIHPDDVYLAENKFKEVVSGISLVSKFELRILTKNGNSLICEFINKPIQDKGRVVGIIGVARDITENRIFQKRMAAHYLVSQVLAESKSIEDSAKRIMEILGATFDWDLGFFWKKENSEKLGIANIWARDEKLRNSSILLRKKTFEKGEGLFGMTWEKKTPLWLNDLMKNPNYLRKSMARKLNLKSSFVFPVKSGDKLLAIVEFYSIHNRKPDENVEKIMNTISYQLSQFALQKEFEAKLKKATHQMEVLFESVPDGITVEEKDGKIIYANPQAAKIFGFESAKRLCRINIKEAFAKFIITDESGRLVTYEKMPAATAIRGKGEYAQTYRFKNGNDEKWYSIKATKMEGDLKIPTVVKVFHDTTKQLEEQKERELFIGFVSHEFRSPLASIKAYVQLLSRRIKNKKYDQALKYLNSVDNQTDKLVKLINNWLDATRVRAGLLKLNIKEVDYVSLVKNVVNDFRLTAKGNKIVFKYPKNAGMIFIDPDRITQVLNNLLSNAVNHSKKKGKIDVGIKRNKKSVVTYVKDQGEGISAKDQKELFKLFKKVDELNNNGMGMGLFISNAIINAHRGKMKIESKSKKGSTFYYELPARNIV